jgi:hypothetical protein
VEKLDVDDCKCSNVQKKRYKFYNLTRWSREEQVICTEQAMADLFVFHSFGFEYLKSHHVKIQKSLHSKRQQERHPSKIQI